MKVAKEILAMFLIIAILGLMVLYAAFITVAVEPLTKIYERCNRRYA